MAGGGDISTKSVVAATGRQVSADLGQESAILELDAGIYFGLNHIGSHIWKLVQTPTCVADIRDKILADYDVAPERCERDVLELLRGLIAAGLVEVHDVGTP